MGVLASLVTQITYTTETSSSSSGMSGGAVAAIVIGSLVFWLLLVVGMWKTFTKAGQPGWTAIIPILNFVVILKMAKKPLWWILLVLIPCVGGVIWAVLLLLAMIEVAKAFGKGVGMAILLWIPITSWIGFLILGFGKDEYQLEKEPLF